jgi:cytochrome c-type biogenesis protein
MIDINFGTAFLAGLLTFFAPCTLPLLPAFLGITAGGGFDSRRGVFFRALGFVLGFIVVFIFFGVFAGVLGSLFFFHRETLMQIGGIIVIVFSLLLLNMLRIPILGERHAPDIPLLTQRTSPASTFLIGFAFALGWTPCLGPILGTILVLASTEGTALSGALYLFVYGLGIALPFLLFSLFFSEAIFRSTRLLKFSQWISRIGGVFLLFLGCSLLFGFWGDVVSFFEHFLGSTTIEALMGHL